MSYHIEIHVIDDTVPQVGMDRPEVTRTVTLPVTFLDKDLAEGVAVLMAFAAERADAHARRAIAQEKI